MKFILSIKKNSSYLFIRKSFFLIGLVLFSFILFSNLIIFFVSSGKYYHSVDDLSYKKVAVVLGTSKYLPQGGLNLFYKYRIDAAEEIIEKNKSSFLLLSGLRDGGYNEPEQMKIDLLKRGVDENKLILDYKGFRTWDSIIRANEVYGQKDFIIISQQFHIQRALFIAYARGLNANAYVAQDPPFYISTKTYVREFFARIKLLLDMIFQNKIKYHDEQLEIN